MYSELSAFSKDSSVRSDLMQIGKAIAKKFIHLDNTNFKNYCNFIDNLTGLTAIDSIIIFLSLHHQAELITFDKKLLAIYKKMLVS